MACTATNLDTARYFSGYPNVWHDPGEFAHQDNKAGAERDCGRNPPLHMGKRANTRGALVALAGGVRWQVTRFNRSTKKHETVLAQPGEGCIRLMKSLEPLLGLDRVPTDIHAKATQTPAQLKGQFPGSAVWEATLFKPEEEQQQEGPWPCRVASSKYRPDEETLRGAYRTYFACGTSDGCSNSRCPDCWDGESLETESIECSRFFRVSQAASCGSGRLKGADVKMATRPGPRDEWALGSGGGDDVEVHLQASSLGAQGRVDPRKLTLAKILYFFRHKGNRAVLSGQPPPLTWWVLAYDYVGIGHGNERVKDSITGHPTLALRGRGRPRVYPADAIFRQVHLYHQCPLWAYEGSDRSHVCEEVDGAENSRARRVWRHRFRLATPGSNGVDRYLLNEVHHSVNQDTFI